MRLDVQVLKSKNTEFGRIYLLCKNPGKANKETFHLIVEGETEAFYNTIRKSMAEEAFNNYKEI